MAKKKPKPPAAPKPMGRPKIQISKASFENLCAFWCTLDDISGWFDCSPDTIERWCKTTYGETFADIYKKKAAPGAVSLRRKQFELAQKGNVTLLIWLGKQKLDQRDHFDPPPTTPALDSKAEIVLEWVDEDNPEAPKEDHTTKKV